MQGCQDALDAVEFAVCAFEADSTFNAGYGGALTTAGQVELDAALMEGAELHVGAVASSMGLPHPASVARRLLEVEGVRVLAAHGAQAFARAHNLELCQPDDLITDKQRAKWAQQGLRSRAMASRSRNWCWVHNSTHMPCAYRTSEMQQPAVLLQHQDKPIKD